KYLPEVLAMHRQHARNTGIHSMPTGRLPEVELWEKVVAMYPDIRQNYGDLIRAKCAFHHLLNAIRCFRRGYYALGARMLWRGVTYDTNVRVARHLLVIIRKFLVRQSIHHRARITKKATRQW